MFNVSEVEVPPEESTVPLLLSDNTLVAIAALALVSIIATSLYLASNSSKIRFPSENSRIVFEYP